MIPILEITAIAVALVVSANVVTAWLIDLVRATNEFSKRAVALVGSTAVTLGMRYLGYAAMVQVFAIFSPGTSFPGEPNVPAEFGFFNWVMVVGFTWAMSGGVVDLRKQIGTVAASLKKVI